MTSEAAAAASSLPFVVRAASEDDLPAINAIYNFYVGTSPATFDLEPMSETWRRDWFETRRRAGFPVLVADFAGGVAGWCCLSAWSPKKAYQKTADESIYIADPWRGRGVGKGLLTAILQEARAMDLHVIMAGIVGCQEPSLALHRSAGFVEAGRYAHMGYKLGSWHDVHWYQRHLWSDQPES